MWLTSCFENPSKNLPGSGPVHFLIWPGILLPLEKQNVSAATLESRLSYTLPTCPASVQAGSDSCCCTFPYLPPFSSPWVGHKSTSPALFLTSPTLTDDPPPDGLLTHHLCHGNCLNMSKIVCPISSFTKTNAQLYAVKIHVFTNVATSILNRGSMER